jgi:hypothetical protein
LMFFVVFLSFVKATDVIVSITINPWQITFWAPVSLSLWSISLSQTSQNKEWQFDDYFRVSDLIWSDSGYNTTVVSDGLVWPSWSSPLTWIYLMAWSIWGPELLLGTTWNVQINSALSSDYYSIFNVPVTYIYRPQSINYWKVNKYWDKPWIRIVIPPYTQPWMYSWTIYFDI